MRRGTYPAGRSVGLRVTVACALALCFCAVGWGSQIVKWDFSGLPGGANNFGPSPMAATASDANVAIAGLTRGGGVGTTGTGAGKAWGGNAFTATSQSDAIAANAYATFGITVNSGYTMSLSEIPIYNIRRSGTGPTTGIWQYRVNGGAFTDIGGAIAWGSTTTSAGNDQSAIALSGIPALQNLPAGSVVTFRIVCWGGGSAGTWYFNDQSSGSRDLILTGTVTPAPGPSGDTNSMAAAPGAQVAAGDVTSRATSPGAAVAVFAFTLQDLGTTDTNATRVTQLTVKPASGNTAGWAATIQGVTLSNVSDAVAVTLGAPTITDAAIAIPIASGNLAIPNGASKELRLSVYLKTSGLVDASVLKFRIDSAAPGFATDPAASSGFAATFLTDVTGNAMTLRVSASKLAFVSVPSSVGIGLTFSATVQAQDANGNVDLDEATAVTVSKATGNGSLTGGGTQNLVAGAKAFAALSFDTPGTNTLQAAGGSLASAVSGAIVVSHPLSIFHVNDMHARVTPHYWQIPRHGTNTPAFELVGGAAYLAAKMLSLKSGNPNSLVLDAGDISEGNPLGDLRGNGAMIDFYNILDAKLKALGGRGLDASVVGNHDVRFRSYVDNLKTNARYPVISMNICSNGTKSAYFAPYVIVTVNGTRIGILGYSTESSDLGSETAGLLSVVKCDWTSADSTKIHVKDYVNELRTTRGCDVVVLLAHIGQTAICADTSTSDALLVDDGSVRVPEVAITGHWHSWAETVWQPSILNHKTIFAESGSYMKYIGELQVAGDGRYVCATQHVIRCADLTPVPEVTNQIAALEAEYAANTNVGFGMTNWPLHEVVGYTSDDLLLDNNMKWWTPNEYPWSGDNTAGEWICDAMRWKSAQLFGRCDISIESGGGVRSDIPAGPVTFLQIYETFPWNDDLLWVVTMTGQEILNYIKTTACNAGFSKDWIVTAHDGVPVSITYSNQPINLSGAYEVAINNYMYAHPPNGVSWSDKNPRTSTYLCRDALVEYTRQFTATNPMSLGGPRYRLDTEFSGGFRAVVTMLNDNDSRVIYESAFARLLTATPETAARRGSKQVPASLVNADGTVNPANRLSEIEFYRSFLAFRNTGLRVGDIVEIWGKNSAYQGNPEFVDQEGIQSDGVEFKIVGHDATLALPEYAGSIHAFWNDDHKNHYVKFYARKTGANTVMDQNNTALGIMDVTAYANKSLPGTNGALLQLTGVPTSENFGLRFRCDSATIAADIGMTDYPPTSAIQALDPIVRTNGAWTLAAGVNTEIVPTTILPSADAQVVSGSPSGNYGSAQNLYVQSANSGSYGNERAWLKFDLSALSGTVTGARLKLWCWKAAGASLPVVALGSADDSWTETGLTWNNQPNVAAAQPLYTNTLPGGVKNVWYTWDVTSFVQGQSSGDKTASIVLKAVTENSADATSPSYGFDAREYGSNQPYLEVDTVGGASTLQTVAQVRFFYRFSTNAAAWGAWTQFQALSSAPWTTAFACPDGNGYYEFYSVAVGDQSNVEPAPWRADAAARLAPPGSFDAWQARYFGGPDDASADPDADPDRDGFSNSMEYSAGTDPTNAVSVLRITALDLQGGNLVVRWSTAGGRTNVLQVSHNLDNGFSDLTPVAVGGTGDTITNAVLPTSTDNAPAFYRIRVGP